MREHSTSLCHHTAMARRLLLAVVLLSLQRISVESIARPSRFTQTRQPVFVPGRPLAVPQDIVSSTADCKQHVEVVIQGDTGATWRGWGTSLAWFANFAGGLPPSQLQWLLDTLFDQEKGLGLDLVRYVLPGGLNPELSPQLAALPFQASQGYRPNQGGPYDWAADANQRNVLFGAIQRGAIAEAVSFSPPWWMTISGDVSGNQGGLPNLSPGNYSAFAEYLADVLQRFKLAGGLEFAGLSPFHEPLQSWWTSGTLQEGCSFTTQAMAQVMLLLRKALDDRGLGSTPLVGVDDWAANTQMAFLNRVIARNVQRISLHAYQSPLTVDCPSSDGLQDFWNVKAIGQVMNKEVWITEWGPLGVDPQSAPDLDLALVQGRAVVEMLNTLNASAFLHWQAVVPTGDYQPAPFAQNVGLIRTEFNYSVPFLADITKQYWVQMHFSRWIRPGARILTVHPAIARLVLVAYEPSRRNLVVTAVNQQSDSSFMSITPKYLGVKLTSLDPGGQSALVYRTSANETYDLVFQGNYSSSMDELRTMEFNSQSITTYVFIDVFMTG